MYHLCLEQDAVPLQRVSPGMLPRDILILVFSYCDGETVALCACVSHWWSDVAASQQLWERFFKSRYDVQCFDEDDRQEFDWKQAYAYETMLLSEQGRIQLRKDRCKRRIQNSCRLRSTLLFLELPHTRCMMFLFLLFTISLSLSAQGSIRVPMWAQALPITLLIAHLFLLAVINFTLLASDDNILEYVSPHVVSQFCGLHVVKHGPPLLSIFAAVTFGFALIAMLVSFGRYTQMGHGVAIGMLFHFFILLTLLFASAVPDMYFAPRYRPYLRVLIPILALSPAFFTIGGLVATSNRSTPAYILTPFLACIFILPHVLLRPISLHDRLCVLQTHCIMLLPCVSADLLCRYAFGGSPTITAAFAPLWVFLLGFICKPLLQFLVALVGVPLPLSMDTRHHLMT